MLDGVGRLSDRPCGVLLYELLAGRFLLLLRWQQSWFCRSELFIYFKKESTLGRGEMEMLNHALLMYYDFTNTCNQYVFYWQTTINSIDLNSNRQAQWISVQNVNSTSDFGDNCRMNTLQLPQFNNPCLGRTLDPRQSLQTASTVKYQR